MGTLLEDPRTFVTKYRRILLRKENDSETKLQRNRNTSFKFIKLIPKIVPFMLHCG